MMKAPFRELTVTCGRDVLGTIKQKGVGRFDALLPSGRSVGMYGSAALAAEAIYINQPSEMPTAGGVQ